MSYREKVNFYLPKTMKQKLEADAALFEVTNEKSGKINWNDFLSRVLLGYYDQFNIENQRSIVCITKILKEHIREISDDSFNDVSREILQTLSSSDIIGSDKNKTVKVSLRPTAKTEAIILDMNASLSTESISSKYVSLFASYLNKPTYIREQIVYKKTYDDLYNAIQSGTCVQFSVSSKPTKAHYVFGYEIVHGQEELFNYLLCAEKNNMTGDLEAVSYRLCRITNCRPSEKTLPFNDTIKGYLDDMKRYGPAFAINDSEECSVFLTEAGHKSYGRVYFQRPQYSNIERAPNGYIYHFDCSKEHVERYFRRFNAGEAVVTKPDWLKTRILESYKKAIHEYEVIK